MCIIALGDKDSNIRRRAVECLAKVSAPEAIDMLSIAATDKIRRIRQPAIQALILTSDKRAIGPLVKALRDIDAGIVRIAAKGLLEFGKDIVDPVVELLNDPEWHVRKVAVDILGKLGDKRAIPHLVERLVDQKADICRTAASSLKKLGEPLGEKIFNAVFGDVDAILHLSAEKDPRSIPPLLKALKDREWKIRKFSAETLGGIADPETLEPLADALADPDAWVRQAAAQALGQLNDPRAIPSLVLCLSDLKPVVRGEAALSLGILKAQEAVDKIIPLLDDGPDVREKASRTLGEIGGPAAVEPLIKLLDDRIDTIRNVSAMSLGQLEDTRAVDPILQADSRGKIENAIALDSLDKILRTNRPVKRKYKRLMCLNCLSRFTEYSRKFSIFQNNTYYACRVCRGRHYHDNAKEVVAVIDRKMDPEFENEKNRLLLNWFLLKMPFDFDSVHIIDADPFDVEEFVMIMRNDNDDFRLKNLKSIKVRIAAGCSLPKLKINLLKGTFGKIIAEK